MDLLRGQIAGLARGPAATVAAGRRRINGLESAIDWLTISGLALGLLAGLAGVALFTSGISRRIIAAAVNADLLGQGLPLEPRPRSRDEIGRLARAHRSAEELLAHRAAELTTARDQALRATRAKTMFLSRTSHELRTPLNSILGFAQLLELSELGSEDRESVRYILGAGRHLLALINDVIDIARIESGELSLSIEPVPVAALIAETSQLMRPLATERSITITQQCGESGLAVRADRRRLSQILVNLISNAIKYNHRGGSITITSHVSDGQAIVEVADTGAGLTEDELDRIFIPFERLGAEQTEIEGTGIGLPLARTLTEAMDGQLAARSTPGKGSVFIISLPRAPDMAPVPVSTITPITAAAPDDPGTGTIDVLYIEDNPANVEVVARYLKTRPGARVRSATTGEAGIESALRKAPTIVLLDLHLSGMSGEHVLAELKAEPATAAVPIAILSADATPGTIRRLKTKGAMAYLTKPLDLTELGTLLDSITPAAHAPIGRLPVHADHATGGALTAGRQPDGQRMQDI